MGPRQPDIFDFDRFTSAGNYLFSGSNTAPAAYFSLNGGVTKLADYGQTSDPSDFLNSGVQGSTDPFNEFYSNSTQQSLTAMDLKQLDALGFHLASWHSSHNDGHRIVRLDRVGYRREATISSIQCPAAPAPSYKYGGAAFVAGTTMGRMGADRARKRSSGGYEVAFKIGMPTVTRSGTLTRSGNLTLRIALGTTSGSSTALESLRGEFSSRI